MKYDTTYDITTLLVERDTGAPDAKPAHSKGSKDIDSVLTSVISPVQNAITKHYSSGDNNTDPLKGKAISNTQQKKDLADLSTHLGSVRDEVISNFDKIWPAAGEPPKKKLDQLGPKTYEKLISMVAKAKDRKEIEKLIKILGLNEATRALKYINAHTIIESNLIRQGCDRVLAHMFVRNATQDLYRENAYRSKQKLFEAGDSTSPKETGRSIQKDLIKKIGDKFKLLGPELSDLFKPVVQVAKGKPNQEKVKTIMKQMFDKLSDNVANATFGSGGGTTTGGSTGGGSTGGGSTGIGGSAGGGGGSTGIGGSAGGGGGSTGIGGSTGGGSTGGGSTGGGSTGGGSTGIGGSTGGGSDAGARGKTTRLPRKSGLKYLDQIDAKTFNTFHSTVKRLDANKDEKVNKVDAMKQALKTAGIAERRIRDQDDIIIDSDRWNFLVEGKSND